jgi:iron complex transport system ATP-binding protein
MGVSVRLRARGATFAVADTRLVDGIDLDVHAGELVALVGPNGAGKSTLLRLLAGELAPTRGTIELDGEPLAGCSPLELARRRAVMPQDTVLRFAFTVLEVVQMGRFPHPAGEGGDEEAVDRALAAMELEPLAERTFPTLSGGERARATMARVLAQSTPVLLLDEPTASLDLRHQERGRAIAREAADAGGAVVAVLHDLNLAAAYSDRLGLLHGGRLAGMGPPWDVLRQDLLETVFEHPVTITRSPAGDAPLVVPDRYAAGRTYSPSAAFSAIERSSPPRSTLNWPAAGCASSTTTVAPGAKPSP